MNQMTAHVTYRKTGVDGKMFMAGRVSRRRNLTISIRTTVVVLVMTNGAVLATLFTPVVLVGKIFNTLHKKYIHLTFL